MDNPRLVGHIVAVQGFRIKVELLPETRSALRATLDGVQVAIAINAYLTFSLGAGKTVIGIISDLEARESFDPTSGDDLSLELMKSRRVASVQLLGTIERVDNEPSFSPGISVLPTLDTPAEIGSPDILRAVFEIPPRRNQPEGYDAKDFDRELKIGYPTGQSSNVVRASYNDLFSRPLAIVGDTGSGKSYSVSSLIQKAMKALDGAAEEPHVFILDINGEYEKAFPSGKTTVRQPDRVYLNGEEFGVPLWFLNAEEICAWLSASEQTQEPVLKDWWAIAKGGSADDAANLNSLQNAMSALDQLLSELTQTIISQCANFISHRLQNPDDIDHFRRIIPMQARRLLDQVTILASGEAIVFGSAFHIPTRVQFDRPDPGPYSQTAAPFHEWSKETKPFPLQQVIAAWGVEKVEEDSTDEDF